MLDLIFSFHGCLPALVFLIVGEDDGTPGFCIFGAFPLIVRLDPLLEIVSPAGIETAVTAGDNICIIHKKHLAGYRITY